MSSLCKNCGKDSLSIDFIENHLVLVCSLCKTVTEPNTTENESTSVCLDDDSIRGGYDYLDEDAIDDDSDYYGEEEEEGVKETNKAEGLSLVGGAAGGGSYGVTASATSSGDRDSHSGSEGVSSASNAKTSVQPVQTCKGCGGQNLTIDTIHETDHLICEDCGYFDEEQDLVSTHEFTAISGTSGAYQWSRAPKPKYANDTPYIARGKVSAINVIKDVSASLNLRQELTDQAVKLFESIYDDKSLKKVGGELKDTVGAVCVYSVARENNVHVTLKTLMRLHKTNRKVYTRALNLLRSISQKPVQMVKVSSLAEHILAAGKFEVNLIRKMIKLIDVCERAYLTQGRSHENVVICVAHFVWVSENIAERKSVRLKKFCDRHNLPYNSVYLSLRKKMLSLFMILASQLPYCLEPVKPNMVIYYIGDIIKYHLTLISLANKKYRGSVSSAPSVSGTDHLSESSSSSRSLDSLAEQETLPLLVPPSALAKRRVARDENQYTLPSHIKPSDLDKEEIHESEFMDAEISLYILSPEEVTMKQAVLKFKN